MAAYKLIIDDVEMSQDPFVQADLGTITEWQTLTNPTAAALTLGNGTQSWKYRRVGDTCHVQGHIKFGSTTSITASETVIFTLPTGFKFDRDKMADSAKHAASADFPDYVMLEGYASYWDEPGLQGQHWRIVQNANAEDQFYIVGKKHEGSNTSWTDTAPETWGTGSQWVFNFSFPVQGWGSTNTHIITPNESVQPSRYSNAGDQEIANNTPTIIDFDDKDYDDDSLVTTGGSWKWTCPQDGYYHFDTLATLEDDGSGSMTNVWMRLKKNGSATHYFETIKGVTSSQEFGLQLSGDIKLVKDDYLQIEIQQNSGVSLSLEPSDGPTRNWFSIHKVHHKPTLSAIPYTKWQRKNMSTSVVDGNGWVHKGTNTGFKFENLTVGKTYKLTLNAQVQVDKEDKDAILSAYHGGTGTSDALIHLVNYRSQDPPSSADYTPGISEQHKSGTVIFTAVSGTDGDGNTGCFVHFHWSATAGMIGGGSSGYERTFAILEEISMHEETDIW